MLLCEVRSAAAAAAAAAAAVAAAAADWPDEVSYCCLSDDSQAWLSGFVSQAFEDCV